MYTGATAQVSRRLDQINQETFCLSGHLGNERAQAIASRYLRSINEPPSKELGGAFHPYLSPLIQGLEEEFYSSRRRYRQLLLEALERDCEGVDLHLREHGERTASIQTRISALAFSVFGFLGGGLIGACFMKVVPDPLPSTEGLFTVLGSQLLGATVGILYGAKRGREEGQIQAQVDARLAHPHLDQAVEALFEAQRRSIESRIAQLEELSKECSAQMLQNSLSSQELQLDRVISYYKSAREELDSDPLEEQVAVIAEQIWVCYRGGYVWGMDGELEV